MTDSDRSLTDHAWRPTTDEEHVANWFDRARRYRTATAYHEAGHCTAAALLRVRLRGATITPSYSTFGVAHVGRGVPDADLSDARCRATLGLPIAPGIRDLIERETIVALAGPAAERRAEREGLITRVETPRADRLQTELCEREAVIGDMVLAKAAEDAGEPHMFGDRAHVEHMLTAASATSRESEAWGCWLQERTHSLIETPGFWVACQALAIALLDRDTLSGRACHRIVRDALHPQPCQ